MMEISPTAPMLKARRKSIVINPKIGRVITRLYLPSSEERIRKVIKRVLSLDEDEACTILETVLHDFSHRHRYFRETLEHNFERVADYVPSANSLSEERRLLIGTYFTAEYSVEAAALFNPSIIQVPNQEADSEGSCRFIMSFRATGEGHISSIEFRSGIIDKNNDIYFDPLSDYVRTPRIHTDSSYDLHLFRLKLQEMGANYKVAQWLLSGLPDGFTFNDLQRKIDNPGNGDRFRKQDKTETIKMARWLAQSNYEILFRPDHQISERVIFPVSESESKGIEDARFVRFVDDDGSVIYYATYTAYNGERILPQLIETRDFLSFKISTLNGKQAQGKGMALFPRKIRGQYVMLSRQDGENNAIMFSDNLHFWQQATMLQEPEFPYEFMQMGNSGSPIEMPEGWLVVTHGVGPLRTYSLGIELLDLDDPTRIISRIDEPILVPNENDREGYVPNVVYSCGAMIFQDKLIIPYASADQRCGIATLQVSDVMARLTQNFRP
ncbi:MAG: glycoside hydrolase family 130 protein [Candidatus Polarisedimenticolaceae bacterium]|nr:glycoside hydrolase family 130 protein [Candidatus Polarisedimenticolaceae bacterium]